MKIIMKISKCKSGLFVENVYKAYLKYNDRLIMTIKKKVLNGF
jgi:nitrogen fixation protein FixH